MTKGVVAFGNNRVLEFLRMELGVYSGYGHFKSYKDNFIWVFLLECMAGSGREQKYSWAQ